MNYKFDKKPKLQIGLIGCGGHMTSSLFPALRLNHRVEVAAVCSQSGLSAKSFAENWNIPFVSSKWQDYKSQKLDAVICSGPVQLHEEVSNAFAQNSTNLFVEKPITRSLDQLKELIEISSKNNSLVQVGYNLRFATGILELKKLISTQKFQVNIEYFVNKPQSPLWELKSVEESFFLAIAVHPLNLALDLLGTVENYDVSKFEHSNAKIELDVIAYSSNGSKAHIATKNTSQKFHIKIQALCENGKQYELNNLSTLNEIDKNGCVVKEIWNQSPLKLNILSNGFMGQIETFLDKIQEKPPCAYQDLLDSLWMYELFSTLLDKTGLR